MTVTVINRQTWADRCRWMVRHTGRKTDRAIQIVTNRQTRTDTQ